VRRDMEEKERREEEESDKGEKMFCVWDIWAYGLLL